MNSIEATLSFERLSPEKPSHLQLVRSAPEPLEEGLSGETIDQTDADLSLDARSIFLQDVSKTSMLPPEQMSELARRARNGDIEARNAMAVANIRLGLGLAFRMEVIRQNQMDAAQQGLFRMTEKTPMYDPDTGNTYSTYMTAWIQEGIQKSIIDNDHRSLLKPKDRLIYRRAVRTIRNLRNQLAREPNLQEVADEMGELSKDELEALMHKAQPAMSLNEPIKTDGQNDGHLEYIDLIYNKQSASEAEQAIQRRERNEALQTLLAEISLEERRFIEAVYGLDGEAMTVKAYREANDLTKYQAQQLHTGALKNLREAAKKHNIDADLFVD
jgi:DNA-directed RNA polymerase sigma subunit (sigma70/sigma32)